MNHYKVGYKAVIEIDKVFEKDGEKLYRAKGMKSLVFDGNGLDMLKSLSEYMEPLKKEAEEEYRLGANAEYEKWKEHSSRIRAEGQNEAWELARKIAVVPKEGGCTGRELFEIFNTATISKIFSLTYPEAAEKVEAWEKAKEEIKVGDVLHYKYDKAKCICVTAVESNDNFNGVDKYGNTFTNRCDDIWEKTGRHIDIDSFLKQIGEE